jgi:endo-1,4-beta-xylanase
MRVMRSTNRRHVLGGLGALAGGLLLNPSPTFGVVAPAKKAREVAAARGILFGSAFDQHIYASPSYAKLLRDECAILTPDYSLKFDALRKGPDTIDFTVADRLFDFAASNKLQMRGHTLIWNDFMPDWSHRLSGHEMERLLDRHIDEVAGRYSGRVHSWDVVNEPIWIESWHEGGLRGGPWYNAMGRRYIARAFRRARQADPHAKLVLNEAYLEHRWYDSPFAKNRSPKPDSPWPKFRGYFLDLVRRLLDEGVPLDAIGMESHMSPVFRAEYDRESLLEFMHTIKAMGLDIYITELDVDDSTFPDDFARRDKGVADYYHMYLRDVLSVDAVRLIVTWELSDRHTATAENIQAGRISDVRMPRILPFDFDMRPKPAYNAIIAALKGK